MLRGSAPFNVEQVMVTLIVELQSSGCGFSHLKDNGQIVDDVLPSRSKPDSISGEKKATTKSNRLENLQAHPKHYSEAWHPCPLVSTDVVAAIPFTLGPLVRA